MRGGAVAGGGPDVRRAVALDDLPALAASVLDRLPKGGVVWLIGELGAGKTTFVQAVCGVLGAGLARSPTYALVHRYASPAGAVLHVDCYRLTEADEARDLALHEQLDGARCLLVEWPERGGPWIPDPDIRLRLTAADADGRRWIEEIS